MLKYYLDFNLFLSVDSEFIITPINNWYAIIKFIDSFTILLILIIKVMH